MIQAVDMSFGFHDRILLDKVSFFLNKGEKVGFLGRNGSGKSTLFKIITGQEIPTGGKIVIPKGYTIGHLDQHIKFSKNTVIEEAITVLSQQDGTQDYLAKKILIGLGFSKEDLDKSIQSFSGGYQLRLHLAKVLLKQPDLLLLDEPTNYLDIVSTRWLSDYLKSYFGEVILITHDRKFMDDVTDHIMGLHRNKIKKIQGKTKDYFEKIIEEEVLHEKTRVNLEKKKAHLESFVERFGAKASKARQAQSRKKQIEKLPFLEQLNQLENLNFSFFDKEFSGRRILELKDLTFNYENSPTIIDNFSLEILKGEKIAIIGKNGFGKSTLLKLIAGILPPVSGFENSSEDVKIGYFGQTNIQNLKSENTIYEEIQSSNALLRNEEIMSICGAMLFSDLLAQKKISVLSGGEKSRVLLGKILGTPCNLILLDEPTHHLDMESIEALIEAINNSDSAFVIVTHSEEMLKRMQLDKIVYCQKNKQMVFLGDYEEFLDKNPDFFEEVDKDVKPAKQESTKNNFYQNKQLQSDLKKQEKKISDLELKLKILEEEIVLALQAGKKLDPEKLKSQNLLKINLEQEFNKWEQIYNNINNN